MVPSLQISGRRDTGLGTASASPGMFFQDGLFLGFYVLAFCAWAHVGPGDSLFCVASVALTSAYLGVSKHCLAYELSC